ncbi:MAG: LysR substrate-binding domain-containing protein, partial [Acidiferrobacterales bacterium]
IIQALDDSGRTYRIAYSSPSINGIHAAVSAGLAVTALARSILPTGVRPLSAEEGFPQLPPTIVALRRAPGATSTAIQCFATYAVEGFRADAAEAA